MFVYKDIKCLAPNDLHDLFLSVEWASGNFPDKLAVAMNNSGTVFTAWHGDKLVGLVNALDDKIMTAYVHYLLVHPDYQGKGIGKELIRMIREKYTNYLRIVLVTDNKEIGFYEHCGFDSVKNECSPMFITSL